MAEVGPDGNVWVIDWYNYIVQHNPTPAGFKTGKGNAYETELRDKKHGRIYRIVPDIKPQGEVPRTLGIAYLGLAMISNAVGVRVQEALPDSPAKKAGLRTDDQVLKLNGLTVKSADEFLALIAKNKPRPGSDAQDCPLRQANRFSDPACPVGRLAP